MREEIIKATNVLLESGVILYPTDTIWGIGCLATDALAIQKIKDLKKRDKNKSFIVLVENERRLLELVEVPDIVWDIIDLEEKPVTIVYDNPKGVDESLIAEDNSLAIRLTNDIFCKELIKSINAPLVSTSANLSGELSALEYKLINKYIIKGVDYVVNFKQNERSIYSGSSIIKVSKNGTVKVIRE